MISAFAALVTLAGLGVGQAPIGRPLPGRIVPPPEFRQAIERGTRARDGSPGPRYWQQWARYQIAAMLDPSSASISGTETIDYENRSPDTLSTIVLHLHQNIHAPGAVRDSPQEVTGGVRLTRVIVDGAELELRTEPGSVGYRIDRTLLRVRPARRIAPGATTRLELGWWFIVPVTGVSRMGHSGSDAFLIAYWYPRVAVYDDLRGWDAEPYIGNTEFYDGFGDYDVRITAPVGWTVAATGALENADSVLAPAIRERLALAKVTDSVVHVVANADRDANTVTATSPTGTLTWRFQGKQARDFVWAASKVHRWDASHAAVADPRAPGGSRQVAIHSFWRDTARYWSRQAEYARFAIEFHSRYLGFPYPWPHATSVEAGGMANGMEYPMMTFISDFNVRGPDAVYGNTSHELAHQWVPMIVSSNEKRHAWIDEGFATFVESRSHDKFYPGTNRDSIVRANYLQVAKREAELEVMRHGDLYPADRSAYAAASYMKASTLLATLRGLLGETVFQRALRTFVAEWAFKHPTPWDLFNTFERIAGKDLSWFWYSWYYQTWTLDQAIGSVDRIGGNTVIVVKDLGTAPMPVRLAATDAAGCVTRREIPVSIWLTGATVTRLVLGRRPIRRVEIDPDGAFPDIDRSNNVWPRDAAVVSQSCLTTSSRGGARRSAVVAALRAH